MSVVLTIDTIYNFQTLIEKKQCLKYNVNTAPISNSIRINNVNTLIWVTIYY